MLKIELCGALDHPVYLDLIKYPPKDCIYIIRKSDKRLNWLKKHFDFLFLRKLYYRYGDLFRLGVNKPEIDLVHVCDALTPTKKNWVVDIEHVTLFIDVTKYYKCNVGLYKHLAEKYLNSRYCKKIMPYTEAAKNSIVRALKVRDKQKIEVVYPAIHKVKVNRKQKRDQIRLLYVGRLFYFKGGYEVLKSFEKISKKYDVKLTIISNIPPSVKEEFEHLTTINWKSNVSDAELTKEYLGADIFIMPSYMDTFGHVYLEAMSYELPIVAANGFSTPEIVEDGKTGLLVNIPVHLHEEGSLKRWRSWEAFKKDFMSIDRSSVVGELIEKISILIEDDGLRRMMSKNAKKTIENGKFSIKVRNEKLKKIYEEALERYHGEI